MKNYIKKHLGMVTITILFLCIYFGSMVFALNAKTPDEKKLSQIKELRVEREKEELIVIQGREAEQRKFGIEKQIQSLTSEIFPEVK